MGLMPTIANPDVITDNTNPLICHVTLSEMPITYITVFSKSVLQIRVLYDEECNSERWYVDDTLSNVKTFFVYARSLLRMLCARAFNYTTGYSLYEKEWGHKMGC